MFSFFANLQFNSDIADLTLTIYNLVSTLTRGTCLKFENNVETKLYIVKVKSAMSELNCRFAKNLNIVI